MVTKQKMVNLNNKKYILTSGCSFTNNVRLNPNNLKEEDSTRFSWPYYLQKELGKEYEVLNYGGATNDNVSLCRIFFTIQKD